MPWADGTPCGDDKWCMRSQCVKKYDLKIWTQVDGGWGSWKSWSSCSRSCGGGIRSSRRECDDPAPSHGGRYCTGDRVRYQSCNTAKCPPVATDFRQVQCQAYNKVKHNITNLPSNVTWIAKYTDLLETDKCKLFCEVENSNAYYLLSSAVVDGTPCAVDDYDMCVAGQCVQAGCDHILGSSTKLDMCGVCGGDGSSCIMKTGSLNISSYGYNFFVNVPAGASNIDIRQRGNKGSSRDDNYIAVRDSNTGKYLVNGDFTISMYKRHIVLGNVILEYSGSDTQIERLKCTKPLPRNITIEVLSISGQSYPQISFTYWISTLTERSKKRKHQLKVIKHRKRRHKMRKLRRTRKYRHFNKFAWKVGRWSKVCVSITFVTVKYDREKLDSLGINAML